MSFKIATEDDAHIELHHADGHQVKIAKQGLSKGTLKKLQGLPKIESFADGGQVYKPGFKSGSVGEQMAGKEIPEQTVIQAPEPGMLERAGSAISNVNELMGKFAQQEAQAITGPVISGGKAFMKGLTGMGADVAAPENLVGADQTPQNVQIGQPATPATGVVPGSDPQQLGMMKQQEDMFKKQGEFLQKQGNIQAAGYTKEATEYENQQKQLTNLANAYSKTQEAWTRELNGLKQDFADKHVDPNKVWHDKGVGGQISTTIGLILGGMGSGLTGGPNQALEFLKFQIDKDIQSQQDDLGSKKTLYEMNLKQYGNEMDALSATKMQLLASTQAAVNAHAARTNSAIAKNNAAMAVNGLEAQRLEMERPFLLRQMFQQSGGAGSNNEQVVAQAIPLLVPKEAQGETFKEAQEVWGLKKNGDEIIKGYDELASSPTGEAYTKRRAYIESLLVPFAKDETGRFNEKAYKELASTLPGSITPSGAKAKTRADWVNRINASIDSKSQRMKAFGVPVPRISGATPIHMTR